MSQKFVAHIEELKAYLDSMSNPEAMKTRIEAIEALLAIKPEDEKFPNREKITNEASFMLKNKDRIMKSVGPDRYMGTFEKAIQFLEKHPPEKVKKKKKVKTKSEEGQTIWLDYGELTRRYVTTEYTLPPWDQQQTTWQVVVEPPAERQPVATVAANTETTITATQANTGGAAARMIADLHRALEAPRPRGMNGAAGVPGNGYGAGQTLPGPAQEEQGAAQDQGDRRNGTR